MDTHYLEDFLDANEAMNVFGDRQDLELRPPAGDLPNGADPSPPEHRTHITMSARQFRNMVT